MKQVLHIFAKDMRHLWIEIAVSLTITCALVLVFPQRWSAWTIIGANVSFSPSGGDVWLWAFVLICLVPMSWWILISSAIHEERLTGDRQFWLTRPYEWPSLLGAKVLIVAVFIYVPLFLAEFLVLFSAGFQPFSYLAGVFYNVLIISISVIFPLIALATITKNFARMTLMILGMIVCFMAIFNLSSHFLATGIATPIGNRLSLFLFAAGCITIALLQYATRRTKAGWVLLAVTLLLITTVACVPPDIALMNHRYPPDSDRSVDLSYRNDPAAGFAAVAVVSDSQVGISIPVAASGIRPGTIIIPESVRVRMDAPDGTHWASAWLPIDMGKLASGETTAMANFNMPRALYDRLRTMSLSLHVSFALEKANENESTRISMPLSKFEVSGFAACYPLTGVAYKPDEIGTLVCRTAIWQPPLTLVEVLWSYDDCRTTALEKRRDIKGAAWVGSLEKIPAEAGISPVWSQPINFSNRMPNYPAKEPQHICPGTPVTFTTYTFGGRSQVSLDIGNFILPELSHRESSQ